VPTCKADPLLGAKVNVLGTLAVFEAAKQTKVRRVVYASSAAVFGRPDQYPNSPQGDDAPLVPGTHYGVFKCCNEGNARIYFQDHGVVSVGLRPWTVYGVGRDLGMTSEPTKAIKAAVLGRPYAISFGGITDFQYADDVAKTFVNSLDRPYAGAKSYNLRGAVVTLEEFRKSLVRVLPEAEKLVTIGRQQIAIMYDLSDDGLLTDLGPMPKTPPEAGIRETVDLFRKLQREGRLDAADLDAPQPTADTVETSRARGGGVSRPGHPDGPKVSSSNPQRLRGRVRRPDHSAGETRCGGVSRPGHPVGPKVSSSNPLRLRGVNP
jgi:nucleoside-diphosphate-sugar epimerase